LNVADIRIICGNTFAYVEGDTTAKWVIKHTKYMQKKLDDIRPQILKVEYAQKAYYNMLEKAAKVELSFNLQKEFLNAMFPDKDVKPGENVNQGPANRRINLENAIGQSVAERNSSIPTIYDAFQGMTRYISYRNQNRTPDQQYEYAMKSPDNQSAYQWMVDALK